MESIANEQSDSSFADQSNRCTKCDVSYLYDEINSDLVCPSCGECQVFFDNTNSRSLTYEEEVNHTTSQYSYKKSNHFGEWLSRIQAKNNTALPCDVLDTVLKEIKKHRMDIELLTWQDIRAILKSQKLGKWYDQVSFILSKVTGKPAPTIPSELEAQLKYMFQSCQEPFRRHKPTGRRNFLSYSYVMYKMLELLGKTEYLPYFPKLKSMEKLWTMDLVWKNICGDLDWTFIRSV